VSQSNVLWSWGTKCWHCSCVTVGKFSMHSTFWLGILKCTLKEFCILKEYSYKYRKWKLIWNNFFLIKKYVNLKKAIQIVFIETAVCFLTDIIAGMYVTYVIKFHLASSQSIPNITLTIITIHIYMVGISF
jgi:hypothetical protein